VTEKKFDEVKIVISGAGAAGTAITDIILDYSEHKAKIVVIDRQGAIYLGRPGQSAEKEKLAEMTQNKEEGSLAEVIQKADVFIGVSAPNVLSKEMVASMNDKAIVFAMANPVPEIDPVLAKEAGAMIVATGRSDFPNQINNVLAFPGIFRGALDSRAKTISKKMLRAAALALANYIAKPETDLIIPSALDRGVAKAVAKAVSSAI